MTSPKHIFVSPHLDDVALSCGGRIASLTAAGEACLVVTVCAGVPASGFVFSGAVRRLHRQWGLEDESAVKTRLDEDAAALASLGAERRLLDFLDDIYRRPQTLGARIVGRLDHFRARLGLRAGPPWVDSALAAGVSDELRSIGDRHPKAIWYAPLGIGHNPDHLAVYAAARGLAENGATMHYYEDFPYAAVSGATAARLAEIGGAQFCERQPIAAKDLKAKVAAIAAYSSQVPTLFKGGLAAMPAAVAAFAIEAGRSAQCERTWRLG